MEDETGYCCANSNSNPKTRAVRSPDPGVRKSFFPLNGEPNPSLRHLASCPDRNEEMVYFPREDSGKGQTFFLSLTKLCFHGMCKSVAAGHCISACGSHSFALVFGAVETRDFDFSAESFGSSEFSFVAWWSHFFPLSASLSVVIYCAERQKTVPLLFLFLGDNRVGDRKKAH